MSESLCRQPPGWWGRRTGATVPVRKPTWADLALRVVVCTERSPAWSAVFGVEPAASLGVDGRASRIYPPFAAGGRGADIGGAASAPSPRRGTLQ